MFPTASFNPQETVTAGRTEYPYFDHGLDHRILPEGDKEPKGEDKRNQSANLGSNNSWIRTGDWNQLAMGIHHDNTNYGELFAVQQQFANNVATNKYWA